MKLQLISFLLLFSTVSCTGSKSSRFFKLSDPLESKHLSIATRNSTTSYFKDVDGSLSGFEYELIEAFAKAHGWTTSYKILDSTEDIVAAVAKADVHIGAAGLTITERRKKLMLFSDDYQKVFQKVVCGKPKNIKNEKQLKKLNIVVASGTSHEELLEKLGSEDENINFEVESESSEGLLENIWEDRGLCTVIDSNMLSVHRRYFPELRVVYTFKKQDQLAWALPKQQTKTLQLVNKWLKGDGAGTVRRLKNKYYSHLKDFDYFDTRKFNERIKTRLPKYKSFFEKASKEIGLSWKFLAAVSYQESQWDPKAVSPTGVRGLMMLTQATAKEVNVKDRTDPEQSIMGGARYLKKIMKRIPSYVPESQRRWMALAAYNIGYYHLRDALGLTVVRNKNPLMWYDVKTVLPLLSQKAHFKNLKYGYARGLEPVIYVARIRNYHELLERNL